MHAPPPQPKPGLVGMHHSLNDMVTMQRLDCQLKKATTCYLYTFHCYKRNLHWLLKFFKPKTCMLCMASPWHSKVVVFVIGERKMWTCSILSLVVLLLPLSVLKLKASGPVHQRVCFCSAQWMCWSFSECSLPNKFERICGWVKSGHVLHTWLWCTNSQVHRSNLWRPELWSHVGPLLASLNETEHCRSIFPDLVEGSIVPLIETTCALISTRNVPAQRAQVLFEGGLRYSGAVTRLYTTIQR